MKAAVEKIRAWRQDPVLFVREVFVSEPDAWQAEVLRAVAAGNRRVALKASKGPGKSTLLAWIGWWFLLTRPHPKVVATSISGDNLKDNLWTEFAKWQARSPLLTKAFKWGAERIVAVDHPKTWWASARTWPRDADSTQQANTLAGIHGDHVLFLVDESGGIPDAVMAAAEGGLANADEGEGREAILIQAGNPTETSGPLYRACTSERHLWWVKEISGDPDDPKRAPRVSIQWAREQIEKYGRDSPYVLVNVFGKFPPGQSNTLVAIDDASTASHRSVSAEEIRGEPRILGVDVARYGDDRSIIQPRQGLVANRPKVFRDLSTMDVADQVAFTIERWKPDAVFVDQTGIGSGVVDRLHRLGHRVIGVDSASRALGTEPRCLNRRAEMWWKMAQWVRTGGSIPTDPELVGELAAPTYKFNESGLLVLEPKDSIKKRLGKSPDLADALALTFAAPVHRAGQGRKAMQFATTDYDPHEEAQASHRAETDYDPYEERTF